MLNDGCKCSSQKCPLSDDFTSPSAPRSSPCSFDYRSYQLHCLEIKPCEAQGEIKPCEALCLTHGCTSCWSWAGVGLPGRIGPTPPASRQCLDNSVSRKGLGSCWGAGREVTAARAAARPSGSQECPPPGCAVCPTSWEEPRKGQDPCWSHSPWVPVLVPPRPVRTWPGHSPPGV